MFNDIETFRIDIKKYYEELNSLEPSDNLERDKKNVDAKFKDKVRKLLPSCLKIINEAFNCKFSIYKEGKDYDAGLKLVDTKVKKTKEEVASELDNYKTMLNRPVDPKLNLAIDIIKVYVDDTFYNVVSNSPYLNEPVPNNSVNSNQVINNSNNINVTPVPSTTEIQYNPYAGKPINDGGNGNNFRRNNYANDKEFAYSDVIDGNSLSIFGSNKDNK